MTRFDGCRTEHDRSAYHRPQRIAAGGQLAFPTEDFKFAALGLPSRSEEALHLIGNAL